MSETELVGSSIKERIKPAGRHFGPRRLSAGGGDCVWSAKETWWRNWMGKDVRGNGRVNRKTSMFDGSASRGELEDDIELKQKCQCETYDE